MANVLTGMTFARAGNTVFGAFLSRLMMLTLFSTDIQDSEGRRGTSVTVPLLGAQPAAQDLQNDHAGQRSAAVEDISSSAVSVSFNQQPITGFSLTDEELLTIHEGLLPKVIEKKMMDCGHSVAANVLNYFFNLMTAANYSEIAHTGLAANFDHSAVVDISTKLAGDGWPVDMPGIVMGLAPAYYGALKKDSVIVDQSASGIPVVTSGDLGRQVDIFNVVQNSSIPPAGGTPATENLTGFVAKASAVAFAMRKVTPQDPGQLMNVDVLVDPETNISLTHRAWYDPDYGKAYFTYECLYGASVGNGDHLQRIRSAA